MAPPRQSFAPVGLLLLALLGACAHSESTGGLGEARDQRRDGSLERLAALEVTLLALGPSLRDDDRRRRYEELRELVAAEREQARRGEGTSAEVSRLETAVQTLINETRASGTAVPAIEKTFGELLVVHSAENLEIDLSSTIYSVNGWSQPGSGQRVEFRRLLPGGSHAVRIEGVSGQSTFLTTQWVDISAQSRTLLACETESTGLAIDLRCTINGVAADIHGEPVAMGEASALVVEDAREVGEPIGVDDPQSIFEVPPAGEVSGAAEGAAIDGASNNPVQSAAAAAQLQEMASKVETLRTQLQQSHVEDAGMRRELDGYLDALAADVTTEQRRWQESPAQTAAEDGSVRLVQLEGRLRSMELILYLLAETPQ